MPNERMIVTPDSSVRQAVKERRHYRNLPINDVKIRIARVPANVELFFFHPSLVHIGSRLWMK